MKCIAYLLLPWIATIASASEATPRTYHNTLTPLKNPPPLLADYPQFVQPVKEAARYEAPPLIDEPGADLAVRAWRFSYNARGIVEVPFRLRGDRTALIVVHPWGIDDGQGWKTPQPAGCAFQCTPVKNGICRRHIQQVVNPLVQSLRKQVKHVMYSLPGKEDAVRKKLYRSIHSETTASKRREGQAELEKTLKSFNYRGAALPKTIRLNDKMPITEQYFEQFSGLDASAKYNHAGFWKLPIPVHAEIKTRLNDVVIYDGDGYAVLKKFLKAAGVRHILLCGYNTDMCVCKTTAGYENLKRDFNVFLIGDATLATFPANTKPAYATNAAVSFAALKLFITQVSAIQAKKKSSARFSKIPLAMLKFVKAKQISGAVTLVADRKRVLFHAGVGYADIKNGTEMTKDSLFAIASMTKPITATALMILVDEGKVKLSDPVSKYIPSFKDVKLKNEPVKRPLTVRDVLTHTSGLVGSQQNVGSLKNTVELLAKRPLGFQPGTKWQYSPGISVAGRIIEVASKQPYEKFLQKRLFDPLGMKETTFFPTKEQQKRLVKLYRPGEKKGEIVATDHWIRALSDKRTANPSGGLFSTAADMAKFYQMVLNGGESNGKRIVSKAAVEKMTRIHTGKLKTGFTPGNGWGLGWCVVRKPQGVTAMLSPGTFGHGGAFGTQGWVDPKTGRIYVLMIQRTGFGNGDASEVRKVFQELAAPR